jgi:Pentapeptide repeats (8 copies)
MSACLSDANLGAAELIDANLRGASLMSAHLMSARWPRLARGSVQIEILPHVDLSPAWSGNAPGGSTGCFRGQVGQRSWSSSHSDPLAESRSHPGQLSHHFSHGRWSTPWRAVKTPRRATGVSHGRTAIEESHGADMAQGQLAIQRPRPGPAHVLARLNLRWGEGNHFSEGLARRADRKRPSPGFARPPASAWQDGSLDGLPDNLLANTLSDQARVRPSWASSTCPPASPGILRSGGWNCGPRRALSASGPGQPVNASATASWTNTGPTSSGSARPAPVR